MRPLLLLSELATGGAERVTVAFAKRLAERGLVATTCTVTDRHDGPLARELADAGLPRVDLGGSRLADPRLAWRWLRLLHRERFDVLHVHGQDAAILAYACRVLAPPLPWLVTRHVLDEPAATSAQKARRALHLAAFRGADVAVAVSEVAALRLERLAHMPVESVRVIPNGVDVASIERAGGRRGAVRASLGLPEDAQVVLIAAVLRPGKGHDLLLRAWPRVATELPKARLLVAGGGELEDGLRAKTVSNDTIKMLGARDDVADLLAACDVAVLPSESEALPTFVMEAAAAGRPVVATDVGGTRGLLVDGVTGILLPEKPSEEQLAGALLALLRDRPRAATMGAAGQLRARARFSIDAQIDATLAAWRDAILRGRTARVRGGPPP